MNAIEQAIRRRAKNAKNFAKNNPDYGKTIGAKIEDFVPVSVTPDFVKVGEPLMKKEESKPKVKPAFNPNGNLTVHVNVGNMDAVFTYRIRSMAGNFPGALTEQNVREVIRKALMGQFGNSVENA